MVNRNDRISIQVGLSGYSFRIWTDSGVRVSDWKSADTFFTTPELHQRYGQVEVALFTPMCTLVPEGFHKPELTRELLADVVPLPDSVVADYVHVQEYSAVLLWSDCIEGTLHKVVSESVLKLDGSKARPYPEMYYMLKSLADISEYNRILASYLDGVLYLVIAQGRTLLLCNTYSAPDFTTAVYFIFLAMKRLQMNPEMSAIYFRTPLTEDMQMTLYRYFRNVEHI